MRVFQETQRFTQWWLQLLSLVLMGFLFYACIKWYALKESVGNVAANDLEGQLVVIIIIPAVVGLMYIFKLETQIDEQGVAYRFFPVQRKLRVVPWSDMKDCRVRQYRPLTEYGGWGYRIGVKGKAFNVKGNKGIQMVLKTNQNILVGTQKPNEAQSVIDKYIKNERI